MRASEGAHAVGHPANTLVTLTMTNLIASRLTKVSAVDGETPLRLPVFIDASDEWKEEASF